MSSFSGNGSVHGFYRLKALITLEQVITSIDGEANWSGVVNFHSMQMSLAMSMRFIFGDHGLK